VYIPGDLRPDTSSERVWRNAMEGFTIFLAISLVASVLIWLVKTLVQHRRWSRVSKVQAEVHNKLMDRFSSNEELLAYIGTPAGKRFLESAPLAVDTAQQALGAPAGRILWSVQAGLVVAAAGAGLEYVSSSVNKDIAQPLSAFGVLGISIGIGFILSAIVSFILSRKLGLWPAASPASAAGND
jgi:C4-dicarboxylate-specific signal transduction histidine kinase